MTYKNIKKRTFEIIQASKENDIASRIFDICLIVLILKRMSCNCRYIQSAPESSKSFFLCRNCISNHIYDWIFSENLDFWFTISRQEKNYSNSKVYILFLSNYWFISNFTFLFTIPNNDWFTSFENASYYQVI